MNENCHILIIDDELSVREMLSILMKRQGFDVTTASNGNKAMKLLQEGNRFDLVITDLAMDRGDGLQVLSQVKTRDPHCPVIMITAFGTTDSAVKAMKKGAFDYVNKPFNIEEFKVVVAQALEHRKLVRENIDLRSRVKGEKRINDIIGHSEAIKQIIFLCEKISNSPAAVLLTGESGTGKEVIARAIHFNSNRKSAPFIPVNCGALPEQLMESELFGHMKGAFTGATENKTGLVQAAEGGTLFLDEVGELPVTLQVKLLRALQEKTVRPVGGQMEVPVDVRIISATNQNLQSLIENGAFRTDLYYRLNVISIEIPPLRRRKEDIKPLIDYFLPQIASEAKSQARDVHPAAMRYLMEHRYPGNVRELKNILERAVALASGDLITPVDLPPRLTKHTAESIIPAPNKMTGDGIDLDATLAKVESQYIKKALDQTGGVQSAAAKLLGITVRSLRYRLNRDD
ncbi:MAG: sigma-54-dependent Fis family transcriptional regulator [Deltaproteobacteria bacterium]|nr:sigma-54-dependent Fis family transcriptional regulator [Deltaproteobacteria bacterium]